MLIIVFLNGGSIIVNRDKLRKHAQGERRSNKRMILLLSRIVRMLEKEYLRLYDKLSHRNSIVLKFFICVNPQIFCFENAAIWVYARRFFSAI